MVHVFIADITNLPDALESPEVMEGLPDDRKEKILRIKRLRERKQSLGAGLLLEKTKQLLGQGLTYNLSHSGDYVICSASDKAIGCDIEKIEKAPLKVAARYFCPKEAEYLNGLGEAQRNDEFYRIWTIKESYVKMLGRGLAMGLDSFEVKIGDETILLKDEVQIDCYIKEFELEGYKVSICSEEKCYQENITFIEI